jgi:hypothetical protein
MIRIRQNFASITTHTLPNGPGNHRSPWEGQSWSCPQCPRRGSTWLVLENRADQPIYHHSPTVSTGPEAKT